MTKKTHVFAVLAAGIALAAASCKSAPQSSDDAFRNVYARYRHALVLEGAFSYTVQSGDTLARISWTLYHDGFYYPIILLASNDVVLDPDKIEPGMELVIPNLQRNLEDADARKSIILFLSDIANIEDERGRPNTADGIRSHARALEAPHSGRGQ